MRTRYPKAPPISPAAAFWGTFLPGLLILGLVFDVAEIRTGTTNHLTGNDAANADALTWAAPAETDFLPVARHAFPDLRQAPTSDLVNAAVTICATHHDNHPDYKDRARDIAASALSDVGANITTKDVRRFVALATKNTCPTDE